MDQDKDMSALERLHTGTEGLRLPDPKGPPWLAQIDTVNDIATNFGAEVLRRFGEGDEDAFMKWLDGECFRLNSLFLGYVDGEKREDFQRSIWNMPQNLGASIGPNLRIESETHHAVRDAFMVTAAQLIDAAVQNQGAPVEQWGWQITGLTEALARALIGLPSGVGETDE